jgi:hypothetical protein
MIAIPNTATVTIQRILAANMSPAEAAQVLAQRMSQAKIRPFKELIQVQTCLTVRVQ